MDLIDKKIYGGNRLSLHNLQLVLMYTVQCNNNFIINIKCKTFGFEPLQTFIVVLHLITKQKMLDINYCYLYMFMHFMILNV